VTSEHAQNVLGFKPTQTIGDIVRELVDNHSKFKDVENPAYYNIDTFKRVDGSSKRTITDEAHPAQRSRDTARVHEVRA
jgi:hypothetical protein